MSKKHRTILEMERSLGFRWESGMCRSRGKSCSVPAVKSLLADIDKLKEDFVHVFFGDLRSDDELIERSYNLFSTYGPLLWPKSSVDTRDWLVEAAENDWNGLYPEDLSYFNPGQRKQLQVLFVDLVIEKCVRYHGNQRQKLQREQTVESSEFGQPQGDADPDSTVSPLQMDSHSTWDGSDDEGPVPAVRAGKRRRRKTIRFETPTVRGSDTFEAPMAPMVPRDTNIERTSESLGSLSSGKDIPVGSHNFVETGSNTELASEHAPIFDPNVRVTVANNHGSLGIQESNTPAVRKASSDLEADGEIPSKRARLSEPAQPIAVPDRPVHRTQVNSDRAETASIGNEPLTALERARAAVYWHSDTDCPTYIRLGNLKTHGDLFEQLRERRPVEFHHRSIIAVQVRITNAEASGITENPNCRIEAVPEYGEEPFAVLIDALSEDAARIRPKLKLTVEFSD